MDDRRQKRREVGEESERKINKGQRRGIDKKINNEKENKREN